MVRFLVILAIAAVVIVVFWPYVRKLDIARQGGGTTAPAHKGGTLFFAIAVTVALTFVLSAVAWLIGR